MSIDGENDVQLPNGYRIRRVEQKDFPGVVETLNVLTKVGQVDQEMFSKTIEYWNSVKAPSNCIVSAGGRFKGLAYNPLVVVDGADNVVATGMLFIESKLIHGCGIVGHIEDIAVASNQQGKRLGLFLIKELTAVGRAAGCYKIILDCDPKNEEFYKKCGYHQAGLEMQIRFRE